MRSFRIRPPVSTRRRCVLLAAALAATLAACGRADGDGPVTGDGADGGEPAAPHPRAAYLTSLTFVGFEPSPSLIHLRFENVADRNRLALSYQAWVAGRDEWSSLLRVEDTIPVARGAWRVVPVEGLRLGIGAGAQIESLRLPVEGAPLRVEALDVITSWSSSTGQRETLRSAELVLGSRAEPGLLLQRRRARPLEEPRAAGPSQAFVLTDTLGNGMVILRNRTAPDAPPTVWAWLDGERVEWTDALLLSLAPSEESPGRWSMEIAREDIVLEVEAAPPVRETALASGSGYRMYPVRATLSAGEERRTMSGIGLEDDGP